MVNVCIVFNVILWFCMEFNVVNGVYVVCYYGWMNVNEWFFIFY